MRTGYVTTRRGTVTAAALHNDLCRASNARPEGGSSAIRFSLHGGRGVVGWSVFLAPLLSHAVCHLESDIRLGSSSRQVDLMMGSNRQYYSCLRTTFATSDVQYSVLRSTETACEQGPPSPHGALAWPRLKCTR